MIMYIPSATTGLLPVRMRLDERDEFGNTIVKFSFDYYDNGSYVARWNFTTLDIDGVSTSGVDQRLSSGILETPSSPDDVPLLELDAGLQTLSDAPSTSALQTQDVSLSLGGALVGKWSVTFEVPIHEFNLDGAWAKL